MANNEQVALLKQGVVTWNKWRRENSEVLHPDLTRVALSGADLSRANLRGVDLSRADLRRVDFTEANLVGANLSGANLRKASLSWANLIVAHLHRAKLSGARLSRANLLAAKLSGTDLRRADLFGADLREADLTEANLSGARLQFANLVETDFSGADLTGCHIYGASAWGLKLDEETKQQNLVITPDGAPEITVDSIEVAQFMYLLLDNPKIRDVIDTIGRKAVLILGRFTPERKAVLDALREELRMRDYVPILFDFDKAASQDLTATVSTLAHLARFIIADLTDPSSIPYELATVVPNTPVPVKPILRSGNSAFAMFADLRQRHHWVLPIHRYRTPEQLIAALAEKVIAPAEKKAKALQKRRGNIEAELTKPR